MKRWDDIDVIQALEGSIARSPFGQIDGREDFREFALKPGASVHDAEARDADFSKAKFDGAYLLHCCFRSCFFEQASFRDTLDRAGTYRECAFERCNFRTAHIGHEGTRFKACLFDRCDFRSAGFTRPEFDNCRFINCNFKNVQFEASSFDSCVFEGVLDGCEFRNGYRLSTLYEENFGVPRVNRMHNVSFENAELRLVGFAGGCRLDTVTLPREGEYVYARDFRRRLQRLREAVNEESIENRDGVIEFIAILEPDAKKQDEYIINIGEARTEYGDEAADLIKRTLTE